MFLKGFYSGSGRRFLIIKLVLRPEVFLYWLNAMVAQRMRPKFFFQHVIDAYLM